MKSPLEVIRLYPEHDYSLYGVFQAACSAIRSARLSCTKGAPGAGRNFTTRRCARRALAARGIRKGDRVAVMARNNPGHVLMLLALARLGAIMVPVNPEFGVTEARYVMHHAGVAAVACSADTLAVAREAASGMEPEPWFMLIDGAAEGVPALDDLIAAAPDAVLPPNAGADDTCLIVYTSGTTGFPERRDAQPAQLRHRRRGVRAAHPRAARGAHHDRAAAVSHQRVVLFGRRDAGGRRVHDHRAAVFGLHVLADRGRHAARPQSISSKPSARY